MGRKEGEGEKNLRRRELSGLSESQSNFGEVVERE